MYLMYGVSKPFCDNCYGHRNIQPHMLEEEGN